MQSLLMKVSGLSVLWSLIVLCSTASATTIPGSQVPDRPNFIVLLTDDQGWADTSRPADPKIPDSFRTFFHTPNIVRLSENSMNFTSGYSPAPVCTPSRRSIQFGVTPARGGASFKTDFDPAGKLSLPQMIKKCDTAYTCAHFGKWGEYMIGNKGEYNSDPRGEPKNLGYDVSDGFTGNEHGTCSKDGKEKFRLNVDNEDPKRICTMTERAIAFLKEQAAKGTPFYLQMSYYAIHRSPQAKQSTIDKYKGKGDPRGGEFTMNLPPMLEDLDTGIGELLDAVRDLGLEKNTYIFFGSDNGGALSVHVEPDQPGLPNRNAPLSEGKHSLREGGIRVPVMASGPGIEKNSWSREPVVLTDIYATIHSLLHAPFPLPDNVDSANLRDILLGGGKDTVKRNTPGLVFHDPFKVHPRSACRQSDFKVFVYWKPGSWDVDKLELFDLSNDIGEKNDLSTKMPEKAKDMADALTVYLKSINAETPGVKKWTEGE